MIAWLERARRLALDAIDASETLCSWTIRPDVFDRLRIDKRTAGAFASGTDAAPTFLGIPYHLGRTSDRWGMDLHSCHGAQFVDYRPPTDVSAAH